MSLVSSTKTAIVDNKSIPRYSESIPQYILMATYFMQLKAPLILSLFMIFKILL